MDNKYDVNQCMGEHHYGAFQLGAPAGWQRCTAKPIVIITTQDEKGEYKTTCCQKCWDRGVAAGLPIIKVQKIRKR